MNDSPEPPSPSNPYATPPLIEEPARLGVDFADTHMPPWMRVREFFAIHVIVVLSTVAFILLTHLFEGGARKSLWYVTAIGLPGCLGFPLVFAAPGRALFLLFLGFSRDRRLLWFAFGHLVLTAVQASAWYFCK